MNWYIKIHDEQFGPYSVKELIALHQKGVFTRETPVWVCQKNGWEWIPSKEVIELRFIFSEKLSEKNKSGLIDDDIPFVAPVSDSNREEVLRHKIWAVAGGKGGVGKSLMASSLAIGLTVLGKRVVLVDLDLGGANLHTLLGSREPDKTLFDFFTGQASSLEEIITKTDIQRLFLISGKSGALGGPHISSELKKRVCEELKMLDADYVILDIGAGSTFDQLDFYNEADYGIIVTMPEPHAIQDAFHFIKTALLRKIYLHFSDRLVIQDYYEQGKFAQVNDMAAFLTDIKSIDPLLFKELYYFASSCCPKIILNQVMKHNEIEDGYFILKTLKDMLQVNGQLLGYVFFDPEVRLSTQKLKPFLIHKSKSKAATCIFSIIVHRLLNQSYVKGKFQERDLKRKIKGIEFETTYHGYRSGIGIYRS